MVIHYSASWILLICAIVFLLCQECQSACSGSTCEKCIASSFTCGWCLQKNFNGSRCGTPKKLVSEGCSEHLVDFPLSSLRNERNEAVRDSRDRTQAAVQIQPQMVKIKARTREEMTIPMTFRAANNFPVDLYFLFDNSVSMYETIQSLAKLADDIGKSIGEISSNYKFGYGVFQDKVILPFTDTSPQKLQNPCLGSSSNVVKDCAPPFEFRHLLSMTKDLEMFERKIRETRLSGNIDRPEGSLDALLQAIKCQDEIGWRKRSRKLLIFASNGPFKTAGAGKLAGIVVPNDGQCHLSEKLEYDMDTEQDYPSVSQVTDAVSANQVHIIFAVTQNQMDIFNKLSERIPQSVVELLDNPAYSDNQNIRDIIEKKYKEMLSEVRILHNNVTGVDIQIRADSDECESKGTNKCKGLRIGTAVDFKVDVKATECPKDPADRKKTVVIHPDFLKTDTLTLDIEILCDCNCKNDSTFWEVESEACSNGNGTLKCGICDCHKDRYGQFCECDATEIDSLSSSCINPGQNSTECSDAGKCVCGVCHCLSGYSGPYCECNDKDCGTYQRQICGGARGRCACGKCVCEEGYTGNACECPTSNRTCVHNDLLCNGVGTCECGQCECQKKYTGKFCENCFLCGEDSCDIESYRACAQCAVNDKESDCSVLDCPEMIFVDGLIDPDGKICSIKQADGCFLQFRTVTTEHNVTLYVQKTKSCPQPVDLVPIIAGLIGGVVAVGLLLLLLWKILTSFFDKIEYSRFEQEIQKGKWAQNDNPMYKGATTTYMNPMLDPTE